MASLARQIPSLALFTSVPGIGLIIASASSPDRLRTWALELERRTNHNKATVALANKIALIALGGLRPSH